MFLALFPELFLINATSILILFGVVFTTSKKYDYPTLVTNIAWLGFLSLLITTLLLADSAPLLTTAHLFWNNLLRRDTFTYFAQIILLLSTAANIYMCFDFFKKESHAFEFIVLILLTTRSMLLLISAYDSITIYLAIELQTLPFFVIAAAKRRSEFSTEAALKYFILGAFSSAILLFGYDWTTSERLV